VLKLNAELAAAAGLAEIEAQGCVENLIRGKGGPGGAKRSIKMHQGSFTDY
jgi:hypothetical protein